MPENTPANVDDYQVGDEAVVVTREAPIEPPKGLYAKYVGFATLRVIRVNEWPRSIAHENLPERTLEFGMHNGFMQSLEGLSPEIEKVLQDDGSFVILRG